MDDAVEGTSGWDTLEQFATVEAPLFWFDVQENPSEETGYPLLEEEQARAEAHLTLQQTYDPSRDLLLCEVNGFVIPTVTHATTPDGLDEEFSTLLRVDALSRYASIMLDIEEPPWPGACFQTFKDRTGHFGKLCHPDLGLGLWPNACGAPSQTPLSETGPLGGVTAAQALEQTASFEFSYDDSSDGVAIPSIVVELSSSDTTACHQEGLRSVFQGKATVRTGGIEFESEVPFAIDRELTQEQRLDDGEKIAGEDQAYANETLVAENVCGDVSESEDWQRVHAVVGGAPRLCLDLYYYFSEGTAPFTASAETILDDASHGWLYIGTARP